MVKFRKEFIIPYYDSDQDGYIRPEALLTYMGETSTFHSDSLKVGMAQLREHNYAWMLNRWRARFINYPRVKDKIIIETWSSGIDRFYATREFVIYNEEADVLVKGTTQWVFIDTVKMRPIRIPQELGAIYQGDDEKILHDFYDFREEFQTNEGFDFHVRKSDIDYNNHVNNVKYLSWMIEAIPPEVDSLNKLYELDIFFKKETKLGSLINSSIKAVENENNTFLHKITENDDIHAFGKSVWR